MGKTHTIVFTFKKDLDNSVMVQKKTNKINKIFFIPKSIIIDCDMYDIERNLWKDVNYVLNRIQITLPNWYVKKELGFYN